MVGAPALTRSHRSRRSIREELRMPAPSTPDPDRLLGAGEAARLLGVSARTLNRWSRDGRVPFRELPTGARRYRRDDLVGLVREVGASC